MKFFGLGVPELIVVFILLLTVLVAALIAVFSGKKKSQGIPKVNVNVPPVVTSEKLVEYKKMLDDGIITQADFDEKKRQWVERGY